MGVELENMGCDAVVLKDMAGLVPPYVAYQIISGLKKNIKIPVIFHTHDTTGLGATAYYSAIVEAGVDAVDVSCIPFANGTGQPDCSRMVHMLENNERQPNYDLGKLMEIRKLLQPIYNDLGAYTMMENEVIDSDALNYQVPGGMLSNFRNQLKEQKMEDKFDEVFAEVPYVREKLGWIPLVTPTSQIVGTQAMLNVKFGRWKMFSPQAMDVALGYYGRTPAPVDPEVQALASKMSGKQAITVRPADMIKPGMEDLRKKLREKGLKDDDEHCVIYAMFPQQLEDIYTKPRSAFKLKKPACKNPCTGKGKSELSVTVDGAVHTVIVEEKS
jgi:oxaloacetate decarboxylase alpha subunit/pyruvate carboxylase subunit B